MKTSVDDPQEDEEELVEEDEDIPASGKRALMPIELLEDSRDS